MTRISDIRKRYPNLTEQSTGGNCTALVHPCEDGGQLLLTVGEGEAPSEDDLIIDCGIYDAESNQIGEVESIHVEELQAWIASALAARASKA